MNYRYVLDHETGRLYYIWRSTLVNVAGYQRNGDNWYDVELEPNGMTTPPLPSNVDLSIDIDGSGKEHVWTTRALGRHGRYLSSVKKGHERCDLVQALVRGNVIIVPDEDYDREPWAMHKDSVYMAIWEYLEYTRNFCDVDTADEEEKRGVYLIERISHVGFEEYLPDIEKYFKGIAEDGWMEFYKDYPNLFEMLAKYDPTCFPSVR